MAYPATPLLSDNETDVDLLNNEAIARTIIELLRSRPERPLTIGVHGDWGAGKSSILEMIEVALESEPQVVCLKFNSWRFQGFEDAKIALLEGIVSGIAEKRSAMAGLAKRAKEILDRIDWLKVAKKGGELVLSHGPGLLAALVSHGVLAPAIAGAALTKSVVAAGEKATTGEADDGGLLKEAEERTVAQQMKEFREQFEGLLKCAGIDQLVVLIDDLDRCLPDTAVETLEAVRLFLFASRTAFVVAADEAMIANAVRRRFPELPDSTASGDYARSYLEKLIQVPFRIPALGEAETRTYVTLLLIGASLGDDAPEFKSLITAARDRLRRPWKGDRLDAAAVKETLGAELASKVNDALTLSDQVGPILASGTRGNPRQIKRFLNSLQLRFATARARGFGDDVKLPVLAKLMLAERFEPRLFEQVALLSATAADGRCVDLANLEAPSPPSGGGKKPEFIGSEGGKGSGTVATESATLAEWRASPRTLSWARVQPPLGGTDLRPYFFVAKDRRDYFGVSALGHLNEIVDRLLGTKLALQGIGTKLGFLAPAEAGQVFEAVCSHILGGDSFDTEPSGVAGLQMLVKAHPVLQAALVDFLERLPATRVGPWIVKGWAGVLSDASANSRFEALLRSLRKKSPDKMLVTAIDLQLKKV